MKSKENQIILVGGGGHCISCIDVIEQENKYTIKGILDENSKPPELLGYPILGDDSLIEEYAKQGFSFLITVGQIKSASIRQKIAKQLKQHNATIATVVSPVAYVSKHAKIKKGTIVHHHAILNANATIGEHCIINTKALIEHGATIQDFCHISTGAIINGDCTIGANSFIGSNSVLAQCVIIGENKVISAGKFVKNNLP